MAQVMMMPAAAAGFKSLMGTINKGTGNTLNLPEGMVNIGGNGKGFILEAKTNWNPTATGSHDGTVNAMALGDDVYIYAVQQESGIAKWLASKNSTQPDGYTATSSRKIGGFHFGRTRPDAERFNAGYACPVEIIHNSCWDLQHRPKCDPTGMVEIIPGSLWADIYLASAGAGSWPSVVPQSKFNAVPITGTDGYSYSDYVRLATNAKKRLPNYHEFLALAFGVPQGATGASGRTNTGQHGGYGFDCISCKNVDQPSGNVYQAGSDIFDRVSGTTWHDTLNTGIDSAHNHGQWYGGELRQTLFGGTWDSASQSGARCVGLNLAPWGVNSAVGFRAVCDSL